MTESSTGTRRRWAVALVLAVVLVSAPVVARSLPAADTGADAGELLSQVRSSTDTSWSGEVVTEGALQLPDADEFNQLARLLGERTSMRVWWQDDEHWRVDRLLAAGEQSLRLDDDVLVAWDYERARATYSDDPDIRLPRTADLLPSTLGARVLRGLSQDDVSRLPARRVAGRSAMGLRAQPAASLSSIDHADVWSDAETGVPLAVEVYADGEGDPAFTSEVTGFDPARPDDATLAYSPTAGTEVEEDDVLDIADAANQYAPLLPPSRVLGLARTEASDGAVGVYGEGMTQLVAIPLRDREADPLREQLLRTPDVTTTRRTVTATVGPLGVSLASDGGVSWLLAGTIEPAPLAEAAAEILDGATFTD